MTRCAVIVAIVACGASLAGEGDRRPASRSVPPLDCGHVPPSQWLQELRRAVESGEIEDPRTRPRPAVAPRRPLRNVNQRPCLTRAQIFPFEDTNQVLLTSFSFSQLLMLMTDGANALLQAEGDNFDIVGFWINFVPNHTIGAAFYNPVENDTTGLGDPSTIGTPVFDFRPDLGLAGENVEGYVMMWNVNNSLWQPGTGPSADFTRLALGQEFEHRWAMFLPDTLDGRALQGDDAICGRSLHWNWRVDGQGSGMEISEWLGQSPAVPQATFISFNTDIGGVFSYTDLYLMGYVSPAEMDGGNSELRYMETSDCSSNYFGTISPLSSADLIATTGPRVPDSTAAQHHFRTGWVMIHRPGAPPSDAELDKAIAILDQHQVDWNFGTLARGTMNDTLFDDCNCNGTPDDQDIAGGGSLDLDGNGFPDECDAACEGNADCDRDGVANLQDNCQFLYNPNQNDTDSDGVGNACDNCITAPNPTQGPAPFGQTLVFESGSQACWDLPADVVWVRGDLSGVAAYTIEQQQSLASATCFTDFTLLPPGRARYYLARPDCPAGSWQTSAGAEPGRDAALP